MYCRQCDKDTEHDTSAYVADEFNGGYTPIVSVMVSATCSVCDWPTHSGSGEVELYTE